MERIQHELTQGTPEWHQFRLEHNGASEAAAMMGLSKTTTRSELLRVKHTGIAKEFSDFVQTRILDHGHDVEAMARPIAEEIIGDELYPSIWSYGNLSASCDGLTMDGLTAFEHKQWAKELAASIALGELPEEHIPQCQQILMVTGAEKLMFVVSDGTKDNFAHLEVLPDSTWFAKLRAGWKQFDEDVVNYQYAEAQPAAIAAPTMALPALSIQVNGAISLISNLEIFGSRLTEFINGIDKNPSDDQAFADTEAAIKVLEKAQTALEAAEAGALAQTASIDEMRRTVALYAGQARTTRLILEKMVKTRKDTIRIEIQQAAKDAMSAHIATINQRLGKPYMPPITADFAGVMKGKKTIASLRDAVDTELARVKIEANAVADRIGINLNSLRDLAKDHAFLFSDAGQIVLKANDDCIAIIKLRIAEHQATEAKRIEAERERIRAEEAAKLQAQPVKEPAVAESGQVVAIKTSAPTTTANTEDDIANGVTMLSEFVARYGMYQEFVPVVQAIRTYLSQQQKRSVSARLA